MWNFPSVEYSRVWSDLLINKRMFGGLLSVIFISLGFVLLYHLFLYHIVFNNNYFQLRAAGKEEFEEFFIL